MVRQTPSPSKYRVIPSTTAPQNITYINGQQITMGPIYNVKNGTNLQNNYTHNFPPASHLPANHNVHPTINNQKNYPKKSEINNFSPARIPQKSNQK